VRPASRWLDSKNGVRRHEAFVLFLILVCVDELCGSGGTLPFHHGKEGPGVGRQLCASAGQIAPEPVNVQSIDKLDQFNAIEQDWQRLVERSAADPVFLSHAWLRTWWECFGTGLEFRIVLVWAGNDLIGAAPLMKTVRRSYGIRLRRL